MFVHAWIDVNYTTLFRPGGPCTLHGRIERMKSWGYFHVPLPMSSYAAAYNWCYTTFGSDGFASEGANFFFRTDEDAVLFALQGF